MKRLTLGTIVLQNLLRKRKRAAIICLCVAMISGFLFALTLLQRGVQHSLDLGQARLGADLVVVPPGSQVLAQEAFISGQPTAFYMPAAVEAQIAAVEGVLQTSPQVYLETLRNARCCIGEFFLVGFEPETDFTISPWLATHRHTQQLDPFGIITGDRILLRSGELVIFYGTQFSVIGVLEKTGMGIDRTVYIPIEGLRAMIADSEEQAEETLEIGPDQISSVMVRLAAGAAILDVAEGIEAALPGYEVFTASQLNQAVSDQLRGILWISAAVTIALWLMTMLAIGFFFSLIINERQRELGLMRAVGARRSFIFKLVMSEAGLLSALGGLLGVLGANLALLLSAWFVQLRMIYSPTPLQAFSRMIQIQLRIPYMIPELPEILLLDLLLVLLGVLTGVLAALQPAISSSRMEPYEAIRQGE